MALLVLALVVSFIPSLLMFNFLRNNRKDDEEYRKDCLNLFGKGLAICALIVAFDAILKLLWHLTGIGEKSVLIDAIFTCFVVNATVEEMCKFWTARKFIYKNTAKTSRLDIISFLTIAAISFGLLEDIVYVFSTNIGQIIIRGVLMGHVPYELLMGQLYGKSIVEKKPVYKVLAFLIPILLHGSYNLMLREWMPEWSAFVVVTEVFLESIYLIYMIFFIRKKRNDPAYTCPVFVSEETE